MTFGPFKTPVNIVLKILNAVPTLIYIGIGPMHRASCMIYTVPLTISEEDVFSFLLESSDVRRRERLLLAVRISADYR